MKDGTKKKQRKNRKNANGEGSITKFEKNGITYYKGVLCVGRDENGKLIRKTFNSRKKADIINAIADYKSKMFNDELSTNDKVTLQEWYHTYMFEFRKNDLKPSTFERYHSIYKNYVLDTVIGKKKLVDLRTVDLQKYYNKLLEVDEKPASILKTVNRYINTVLIEAEKQGIIKKVCSSSVKLPKVEKEDKLTVLSLDEQKEFINTITGHPLKVLFLMALGTGLREGELLALKWNDLDFDDNTVYVCKSLKRVPEIDRDGTIKYKIVEQQPKTKSSKRVVPIPLSIISELEKHKAAQNREKMKNRDLYNDMKYVFADKFGNPIEGKKPNRAFKSVLKKIELTPIKFHSLRHTYATRLFENDVPIKTVQSLMGHKDINTTMNIYTHVMPEQKAKAVETINDLFAL